MRSVERLRHVGCYVVSLSFFEPLGVIEPGGSHGWNWRCNRSALQRSCRRARALVPASKYHLSSQPLAPKFGRPLVRRPISGRWLPWSPWGTACTNASEPGLCWGGRCAAVPQGDNEQHVSAGSVAENLRNSPSRPMRCFCRLQQKHACSLSLSPSLDALSLGKPCVAWLILSRCTCEQHGVSDARAGAWCCRVNANVKAWNSLRCFGGTAGGRT